LNLKKEDGVGYLGEDQKMKYPYFLSITQDDFGNLWGVTYDQGVWKNNGVELIQYPIKEGETTVLLFSIYKDKQGTLWVCTHHAGVYKFDGESFKKFEW